MGKCILNGFDEELDDRSDMISVMKTVLLENDYFLNCTVLEFLLEHASSIPLNPRK